LIASSVSSNSSLQTIKHVGKLVAMEYTKECGILHTLNSHLNSVLEDQVLFVKELIKSDHSEIMESFLLLLKNELY
jgi:hypothetical protein